MGESDKYPTVREVMDGDAPFSESAYHDPHTGMYTMGEDPEQPGIDFVQDTSTGLHLPKPKTKPITRIVLENGMPINVSESIDEVLDAIDAFKSTDKRLKFSGPAFADEPVYIERIAVKKIVLITQDYIDLKEVELSIKMKEYQQRMAADQLTGKSSGIATPPSGGVQLFPFGQVPNLNRRKR